jgi:hypothetical protein
MDMSEYRKTIDAQIKANKEREKLIARGDRRQESVPVSEDRRSGKDRRARNQRAGDPK